MCRGELSAVIALLMSKYCEAGGSGSEEWKKCPHPPFPCSPMIREWSWQKIQTEKKKNNKMSTWRYSHANYIMAITEIFVFVTVLVLSYWSVKFCLQTEKTIETVKK